MKFFGALLSPKDNRDWLAKDIYSNEFILPLYIDYSKDFESILDQGSYPTCAAHVASNIKAWQEWKESKTFKKFSIWYIYHNRFDLTKKGMTGRDVMSILYKKGDCLESSLPYTDKNKKIKDVSIFDEEAKRFSIKNYAQCNSIDETKKALFLNGPCYISVPCYNVDEKIWIKDDDQTLKPPSSCNDYCWI